MGSIDRARGKMLILIEAHGFAFLRLSIAIVFIWFGALKVMGVSPVAELVASTINFLPPEIFVPFLGLWEVVIGAGFLIKPSSMLTLLIFLLQILGTFTVLFMLPGTAFQSFNPLLLTTEGEFVTKNLILLASGLVIFWHYNKN